MSTSATVPNVKGMVNDPDFLGMSPQDQRTALFRLTNDQEFTQINDGEVVNFVNKLRTPKVQSPEQYATSQGAKPGIPAPPTPAGLGTPNASGSIESAPTGIRAFLDSLAGDIRYGTGATPLGKFLKATGAPGINATQGEGVANTVGGPLIGPVTTAQGVTQLPTEPLAGAGKIIEGIGQTTFPASTTIAPEAASAGLAKGIEAIPSTKRAAQLFKTVSEAAGDVPVDINAAGEAALRAKELADAGGRMPKPVKDFLSRITDPTKPPITYDEARDFYSNISALSANEMGKLNGKMLRQSGEVRAALDTGVRQAAADAGQGDNYAEAMKNYARAKTMQSAAKLIMNYLIKPGIIGGGLHAGYQIYGEFKK